MTATLPNAGRGELAPGGADAPLTRAVGPAYSHAALDGVRGIAAQVVFFGHALNLSLHAHLPENLVVVTAWTSRLAVMVFFALSGFVVALSLRRLSSGKAGGASWTTDYAIHRVARILPPLVLAVAVSMAVGWLGKSGLVDLVDVRSAELTTGPLAFVRGITLTFLPTDATFAVDGPLWSLRQEVFLYVVAGLLAFATVRRGVLGWITAACACAAAAIVSTRFFYPQSLALFGCGALAALYGTRPIVLKCARSPAVPLTLCAILLAPIALAGSAPRFAEALSADRLFLTFQLTTAPVIALGLLRVAVPESGADGSLARLQPLARYAYTLYVLHNPLLLASISIASQLGWAANPVSAATMGLIAVALTQAIAYAGALALEQPTVFRRWILAFLSRPGAAIPRVRA
ncbi:hypothetical protein SLNSH_17365 [Alsobacter soli]|uniref:Acyltransferase 3 domain-containing protein n=1 Tax=Alsobacter soli TaxID=2109933 RepID=A0A2T1HPY8_9HYPH|nr:acyltransferase [Alsobacter soli]PSC03714.1 hypothetical protein SLNSH_17365 [Alsobacter soli]